MFLKDVCSISILLFSVTAASQDDATDYLRGDDRVRSLPTVPEASPSPQPLLTSIAPMGRPSIPKPVPADPKVPGTSGNRFTKTEDHDRSSELFKKFEVAFKNCTDCNAAWAHLYRNDGASCHNTRQAIDIHGLVCNGVSHNAYSQKFKDFVNCIKADESAGKRWCSIFRETHSGCSNPKNRSETTCHYDHAHFGFGCSVRGC